MAGAGYNSKAPYLGANANAAKPSQAPGQSSLNSIFNIPKYGQGSGLGGGIGGGTPGIDDESYKWTFNLE